MTVRLVPKPAPVFPEALLRLPAVKAMVGLGTSEIYQRMKEGRFPRPVQLGLGSRLVAWRQSDLVRWIAELPEQQQARR